MDPIFKCEECGKEFKKKNKFNRHVKETHSDDKPYKCEECGTEFKRNSHLTRHKKLKHSDDPKPFSCNIDNCLQKFATKQHLDRHIKTIHFGDKIKCEECDVFFNKKSLLLKHQTQIHKKQEPFICSVEGCGRGFFREIDLTKHQKVHENKDQGLASLNIKRRRSCLSEGISTEAAFSENFDKVSESSNALNLTLQKTKSKELYLCFYEGCLKAFSRKSNLKNHVKTHHLGISEFECSICSAKYKHKKSLQEHMLKCHPSPKEIVYQDESENLILNIT